MRADRLVAMILLLQRRHSLTARQLAERLEVSERTVLRDIQALGMAGIPVYAQRGSHGGFQLMSGYRLDLSGLRTAELRTLLLGGHEGLLADLGWEQDALTAQDKLHLAIPSDQYSVAAEVTQRFYIDETPWFSSPKAEPALDTIQQALWQNRQLDLMYAKPDGSVISRAICPYALVAKVGVWYLVGASDKILRVYRVSRIQQTLMRDEQCVRSIAFDLRAFWTQWIREFETSRPRYEVLLWIRDQVYGQFIQATPWRILYDEPKGYQETHPGYTEVRVIFETVESACRHILSFGSDIRVIDPPEVGAMVLERARRILAFHSP